MKKLCAAGSLCVAGLMAVNTASAQIGASVSADGAAPNDNAMLDVQSPATGTGKGLLIPRITENQRTNASAALAGGLLDNSGNLRGGAAQGLMVYQTDGNEGVYFNTCTNANPAWAYLGDISGLLNAITWARADSTTNYLPRTGGTMIGVLNMGGQVVSNTGKIYFNSEDVEIGKNCDGGNGGTAVGYLANGRQGVGVGNSANGNLGVAVGAAANGYYYGTAVGVLSDATNRGAAVGHWANANDKGVAVGEQAIGNNKGIAAGYWSLATNSGVAVGYQANGSIQGAAVGYQANGYWGGAAIGYQANGYLNGAAIGLQANGYDDGVAMGFGADGYAHGMAFGYQAVGTYTNIAIGYEARGRQLGGVNRIAIGNYTTNTHDNSAHIRGDLYLDGAGSIYTNSGVFGSTNWGVKAFTIDHPLDPENKILRHFCLEGPEVWNVYAGNVQLVNGQAVVQLPDYYSALNLAGSEIYSLTPVGGRADVWVQAEAANNCFIIQGEKDIKVSWTIKVLRNDPACLEDLKRRPVEEWK